MVIDKANASMSLMSNVTDSLASLWTRQNIAFSCSAFSVRSPGTPKTITHRNTRWPLFG